LFAKLQQSFAESKKTLAEKIGATNE